MPLAQLLQSMRGRCRYCGQQAGVLQRDHQECQDIHQTSWQQMVSLVTQAAADHTFNEATLRQSLSAIAQRSHATDEDIEHALEAGWKQGVASAMSDGIITRDEEDAFAPSGTASPWRAAPRTKVHWPNWNGPGRTG